MRDIFGLCGGALIALLSQLFQAGSTAWWAGVIVAAVVFFASGGHLLWVFLRERWPLTRGWLATRRVPLSKGARLSYEQIEGTEAANFVNRMFPAPDERLSYFVTSFLVNDVPMFGAEPPSSVARPIPASERNRLFWMAGTDNLCRASEKTAKYVNVHLLRPDLKKHLDYLRGLSERDLRGG
jgi:hypothetical protein